MICRRPHDHDSTTENTKVTEPPHMYTNVDPIPNYTPKLKFKLAKTKVSSITQSSHHLIYIPTYNPIHIYTSTLLLPSPHLLPSFPSLPFPSLPPPPTQNPSPQNPPKTAHPPTTRPPKTQPQPAPPSPLHTHTQTASHTAHSDAQTAHSDPRRDPARRGCSGSRYHHLHLLLQPPLALHLHVHVQPEEQQHPSDPQAARRRHRGPAHPCTGTAARPSA